MRICLFLILYLGSNNLYSQQGCTIDGSAFIHKTLPETFYKNEQEIKVVYCCKVINSVVTKTGEAYSIAEIKEIYFGKIDLPQIKISTGDFPPPPPPKPPILLTPPIIRPKKTTYDVPYIEGELLIDPDYRGDYRWGFKMLKDSIYIIYSQNDTGYVQSYFGNSKQFKATPVIKNEIEILKTFNNIFNEKKSGHFIFKDDKGNLLARGNYKKGKLSGVWKNYDSKGSLVSWEDFRQDVYKSYYINGNVKEKIKKYKDSTVTEYYNNNSKSELSAKTVTIKNDSGHSAIIYDYDKNGSIQSKHGELTVEKLRTTAKMTRYNGLYYEFYPNGNIKTISEYKFHPEDYRCGIYKEYYPTGNIKLDAHIFNARRVACWTWYNKDGTFWAEWDYKDGKAPQ